MKKFFSLLLAALMLFSFCAFAEEAVSIPDAIREQAEYAAYFFYGLTLPENVAYQEVDAEDSTETALIATSADGNIVYNFHFDGAGRLIRVSYMPVNGFHYNPEADQNLTVSKLLDLIGAHLALTDESESPFSNSKKWNVYPTWKNSTEYICEFICGPGEARYDNRVTTIYYDSTYDEITHVTFTYLD